MSNNAKRYQKGAKPPSVNPRREMNHSTGAKPVGDESFYHLLVRLHNEKHSFQRKCMHCGCVLKGRGGRTGCGGKKKKGGKPGIRSGTYGFHCRDLVQCRRNRDHLPSILWQQRREPAEEVDSYEVLVPTQR